MVEADEDFRDGVDHGVRDTVNCESEFLETVERGCSGCFAEKFPHCFCRNVGDFKVDEFS